MSLEITAKSNGSARLSRGRRLGVYGVGIGLWLSGGLWLLFHYFVRVGGPFGSSPHPLEPWWLKLHGAFGFASLWLLGLLWGAHVVYAWPLRRHRWSGGVLLGCLAWLVLSGYLLYYLGDEDLRAGTSLLHWSVGLACPVSFLVHRLARRERATAAAPEARPPVAVSALPPP